MAGDIGIEERVVVTPPETPSATTAAAISIQQRGGRVIHHYGPRVSIMEVPPRTDDALAAAPPALPATATASLDPVGALGLEAFALRQSDDYVAAKADRPLANQAWDSHAALPPDPPSNYAALLTGASPPGISAQAVFGTTSQRMNGTIAVGIVIVSGPTAALQFSAAERLKVIAEVQNGLGWLAQQNPSGAVSWFYDIQPVSVSVLPGGAGDKEALWRDPAMAALGYSADWAGVVDYVNDLKTRFATDWSYCAFFTKYPLDWFAYASIGGPRLVMQYDNDGWGPDNIDRVFAHETGHIFQAPDEYASSGCNCGGSWGWFDKPNANCQNCAPGGGIDCIMKSNSWAMCPHTPWHFGYIWPHGLTINNVDSTPASPAACVFGDKLYAAWKANDPSNRIYISGSADGSAWPSGTTINSVDSTPAAPALAAFNNKLYVFWKANDPSNRIYFSSSASGSGFPNGAVVNSADSTPATPAAVEFNQKLYLFWKANDPSNRIYFSASSNGSAWPNGTVINTTDSTPASPAACVFNNRLYVFWKANDPSNRIYFAWSADGQTWPINGQTINSIDSTPAPLSALVFDNRLCLFWKANDPSNRMYVSASVDGATWPAGVPVNFRDSTPAALASALFQDNPYLLWKANDSSNRIYYSA